VRLLIVNAPTLASKEPVSDCCSESPLNNERRSKIASYASSKSKAGMKASNALAYCSTRKIFYSIFPCPSIEIASSDKYSILKYFLNI